MTFRNIDQTSVDFCAVLAEDCEDVGDEIGDLAFVQVDRVGENIDHEIGVDDGGERREVAVSQFAKLKIKTSFKNKSLLTFLPLCQL
jgi:hypothetical protein